MIDTERYHFINGDAYVHAPKHCEGTWCAVHNPSDHHMEHWPLIVRETGLLERRCVHGIGHPDPDSVAYLEEHPPAGSAGTWGIHGCDGCCKDPDA